MFYRKLSNYVDDDEDRYPTMPRTNLAAACKLRRNPMELTLNWTDKPQPETGFDNIQDARDYQAANGGLVIFDDSDNCYRVYSRDNMSDLFEQGWGDTYSKDVVDAAYAQANDGISIDEFHDLCEEYSEPEEVIE